MDAGTTYFLNGHLWVVISDPEQDDERILAVKFNRWKRYLDQSCILDVGEHPFIRERTCVNYQEAMVVPEVSMVTLMDTGDLSFYPPASPALVAKIRAAAEKSRLPQDYIALLVEQELI